MIRLLDTHYRTALGQYINEYFVDTDEEVKSIPQSAPGSYAISAESGTKFYANSAGQWPQDLSKYNAGGIGGGSTGGGVFTVNFIKNEDGSYSADKTHAEITDAFNNNMVVRGYLDTIIFFLTSFGKNLSGHVFVSVIVEMGAALVSTRIVNNDNSVTVIDQIATLTQMS